MELCYIWVSEYKGFINQGFNFSSKLSFEFSQMDNKLTTKKNEKYIKDFFGNNIVNITGVVGQNGAGKTNVLELIQYIVAGGNTIINKPFFAIFENENIYSIYNYRVVIESANFVYDLINYTGVIPNVTSIFFSNTIDGRKYNFDKRIKNISSNDIVDRYSRVYKKSIIEQIKFINSNSFRFFEDLENVLSQNNVSEIRPINIVLTSPTWSVILHKIELLDVKIKEYSKYDFSMAKFAQNFRKKITDIQSNKSIKYFTAFIVYIDFILNYDILDYKKNTAFLSENEYHSYINNLYSITQKDLRIDEIFKFIVSEFAIEIDKYFNVFETQKFLIDLDERDFSNFSHNDIKENIGTYSNRKVEFTLNFNKSTQNFIIDYLDIIRDESLIFNFSWSGISSGSIAYLNLLSRFNSISGLRKENAVIISIDEGDLYFHPKWQAEFLYRLINIIPQIIKRPCQIFLTTHSPFLVSDLPKSNLIFVNKNFDGKLSVIPNEKIAGETFGGNIGELFLDAFFMKGNLISQFAASKINTLISKIKENPKIISKEDKILVEEIGERLIKLQLKKLME